MIGAIDIGGTKIAIGLFEQNGKLVAQNAFPTQPERAWDEALKEIRTLLVQLQKQTGTELEGIGIGCTGPVDPFAGKLLHVDFLPRWEGAEIVSDLAGHFGVPVALENDADAAALGEYTWGAGQGRRTFLFVTVSTGIGAGLIVDGKIYRGLDGFHPEIGHHIIDPSGPLCSCGAHGCWESLASGPAMAQWFVENTPSDHHGPEPVTAQSICERHDVYAQKAIEREGHYLGIGLANMITIFTPEVIALGGGLMRSRHLFWDTIQKTIANACGLVPAEKVIIVPASLGAHTGLYGACSVWLNRFQTTY
ncbi:MAG: ROK family protein [Anaerolineales bacterium]|nr:ROK family protein [Anaerolineales bacterium]